MVNSTVKIFKKGAPNGRIYLYLGKREYVSMDGSMESVEGVAHITENKDYIAGKTLMASLVCTFRHGREEDEVMGVSFKKEIVVDRCEISTSPGEDEKTKLQTRLIRKLGSMAFPFILNFPKIAPNSVLIRGDEGDAANMGVNYEVRVHLGDSPNDFKGNKKSSVSMSIRKVQWAPVSNERRCPTSTVDKGFLCSKGKIVLECKLDNEIVYHGQDIPIHVSIHNNSNKSVKSIRCAIVQHCELTLVQAQYSCKVARLETKDGCPLGPGAAMNRTFTMKPLSQMCANERGLALDASLSKVTDETNLASSSIAESGDPNDLLGVIVSYSIKVKLMLSGMGGELEVDLPFKLLHPRPDSDEADKLQELKKATAENNLHSNKRRQKFQAQDSVLVDTFGTSQEE